MFRLLESMFISLQLSMLNGQRIIVVHNNMRRFLSVPYAYAPLCIIWQFIMMHCNKSIELIESCWVLSI